MTTQGNERELSAREQSILDMYLEGKTMRQIGAVLNMDFSNVCRTLRRPRVRAVIDERISVRVSRAIERSSKTLNEMLKIEAELARSGGRDDAVKLKAAQGIIERSMKLIAPLPPEVPEAPESPTITEADVRAYAAAHGLALVPVPLDDYTPEDAAPANDPG